MQLNAKLPVELARMFDGYNLQTEDLKVGPDQCILECTFPSHLTIFVFV